MAQDDKVAEKAPERNDEIEAIFEGLKPPGATPDFASAAKEFLLDRAEAEEMFSNPDALRPLDESLALFASEMFEIGRALSRQPQPASFPSAPADTADESKRWQELRAAACAVLSSPECDTREALSLELDALERAVRAVPYIPSASRDAPNGGDSMSDTPEQDRANHLQTEQPADKEMVEAFPETIAKLERAKAGSRELDAMIWCAVRGEKYVPEHEYEVHGRLFMHHYNVPPYTTSIDAALKLVPEKAGWQVGLAVQRGPGLIPYATVSGSSGTASTPALALCIAALKAVGADK